MKREKAAIANLPGDTERQTWNVGARGKASVRKGGSKDAAGCYALNAMECQSIPMWINSTDDALTDRLVAMELEKLRIGGTHDPGRCFDWRIVDEHGQRRQLEVTILRPRFEPSIPGNWQLFDAGARFYPLPSNQVTLWREEGSWVAAFSKGSQLAYYHPLGSAFIDSDAAHELRCIALSLKSRGFANELTGVMVWNEGDDENQKIADSLASAFQLPVNCTSQPEPDFTNINQAYLEPANLALRREAQASRAQMLQIAALVMFAFACIVGAAVGHITYLQRQNQQTQVRIDRLAPEAEVVRQAYDKWELLRPAIDPDRYPVELFHRCASALPKEGVRLNHFEIRNNRLVVRGEASNAALAIRYRTNLIALPNLADYTWESPQPELLPDNRATFQAIGVYRYTAKQP